MRTAIVALSIFLASCADIQTAPNTTSATIPNSGNLPISGKTKTSAAKDEFRIYSEITEVKYISDLEIKKRKIEVGTKIIYLGQNLCEKIFTQEEKDTTLASIKSSGDLISKDIWNKERVESRRMSMSFPVKSFKTTTEVRSCYDLADQHDLNGEGSENISRNSVLFSNMEKQSLITEILFKTKTAKTGSVVYFNGDGTCREKRYLLEDYKDILSDISEESIHTLLSSTDTVEAQKFVSDMLFFKAPMQKIEEHEVNCKNWLT